MEALRGFLAAAAAVEVPVLLLGETGTGKSLAARTLHQASRRADGPFLVVNCAGVPEGLFESEFFGHRKGSFTGADADREGFLEAATGGTLFLDEVGELPVSQQGKLLLCLEEGVVRRVGEHWERPVDVRVVAGTGRDLRVALEEGGFRRDLFHRLAVLRWRIPPLRERPEDALYLAIRLLRRLGRRYGRAEVALSTEARAWIQAQPWPGNVRQLAHALEACVILSDVDLLTPEELAAVTEMGLTPRSEPKDG